MKANGLIKKILIALILALVVIFFPLYLGFVNIIDPTEIGIARNQISGKMWLQDGDGFHILPPWIWVTRLDTRPIRVAVTSSGHGYSAKLVQFDKRYWREFVAAEGWRFYWWANRFSVNFGYDEEYRGMKDIMRGYAYGAKTYQFIVILDEYSERN